LLLLELEILWTLFFLAIFLSSFFFHLLVKFFFDLFLELLLSHFF
jgi:predicted permease